MIVNMKKVTQEVRTIATVIGILSALPDEFYLTGSQFFGNNTPSSDWDFFTKDTYNMQRVLHNLGFLPVETEKMVDLGYDCNQFISIYEYSGLDGKIQVQLVQNTHAKLTVQNLIKEQYLEEFIGMEKSQRSKLWSLLLKVHGR